jgi:pimeloyl-ACP methyl ester carboxylesterase
VEALKGAFRCVLVTLPNFGEEAVRAGGFDFPELVGRLAATIKQVQPDGKVSLVTHDWGAYIGYLLEKTHPGLFVKMVALDIGGHLEPAGLKSSLMIIGYQWSLITCWMVGGLIPSLGGLMTKGVGKVIHVPARQRALIRSRYNYPYFYLWRGMLLPWKRSGLLGRYRPHCPVLYLFGEHKPLMFHSPRWLQIVANSGGRAEGIAGAGHWLMETHAETVNEKIADWFKDLTRPKVKARIRYLVPSGEKPVYIASRGGADAALDIGAEFEDREVTIHDARRLQPGASLDRQGFTLMPHTTMVEDFYALESVQAAYEAEITELVLAASGAAEALVFDHTLRSDSRAIRGDRSTREPASVIHNDYTDASAEKRLRDLLPAAEAEERLKGRFAIVNVWRSIAGTVENSPLACCDAATIDAADLVASERRAKDRIGELELVSWNPAHRWYYYPEMSRSEALLIKTFDSARDGRARRSIHTAFSNPLAAPDAPARESIESRVLVFFHKQ